MKKIKLTQGQVAIVDDEDFEYLNQRKWHAWWSESSGSYYAFGSSGARMHRIIMNTPSGMVCDHINHDTLDNRKENLRNCTLSQNQMNKAVRKDNKLREKGISHHQGGYLVQVSKLDGGRYCKSFRNLEDAIRDRDLAVSLYQKEFGYKNEYMGDMDADKR